MNPSSLSPVSPRALLLTPKVIKPKGGNLNGRTFKLRERAEKELRFIEKNARETFLQKKWESTLLKNKKKEENLLKEQEVYEFIEELDNPKKQNAPGEQNALNEQNDELECAKKSKAQEGREEMERVKEGIKKIKNAKLFKILELSKRLYSDEWRVAKSLNQSNVQTFRLHAEHLRYKAELYRHLVKKLLLKGSPSFQERCLDFLLRWIQKGDSIKNELENLSTIHQCYKEKEALIHDKKTAEILEDKLEYEDDLREYRAKLVQILDDLKDIDLFLNESPPLNKFDPESRRGLVKRIIEVCDAINHNECAELREKLEEHAQAFNRLAIRQYGSLKELVEKEISSLEAAIKCDSPELQSINKAIFLLKTSMEEASGSLEKENVLPRVVELIKAITKNKNSVLRQNLAKPAQKLKQIALRESGYFEQALKHQISLLENAIKPIENSQELMTINYAIYKLKTHLKKNSEELKKERLIDQIFAVCEAINLNKEFELRQKFSEHVKELYPFTTMPPSYYFKLGLQDRIYSLKTEIAALIGCKVKSALTIAIVSAECSPGLKSISLAIMELEKTLSEANEFMFRELVRDQMVVIQKIVNLEMKKILELGKHIFNIESNPSTGSVSDGDEPSYNLPPTPNLPPPTPNPSPKRTLVQTPGPGRKPITSPKQTLTKARWVEGKRRQTLAQVQWVAEEGKQSGV